MVSFIQLKAKCLGKPSSVDHFSYFNVDEIKLTLGKQKSNCKIPLRNLVRQ